MTKEHTITIEGLPEGWKAVAYRPPKIREFYLSINGVKEAHMDFENFWLIVEKIQPRRIVLEETGEDSGTIQQYFEPGFSTTLKKKWKLVKEAE